jgi:hypothetical protein
VNKEQVTTPLERAAFIAYVTQVYEKKIDVADRLFDIALEFVNKAEPCAGGLFWCTPVLVGGKRMVVITDDSGPSRQTGKVSSTKPAKRVAQSVPVGYSQRVTETAKAAQPRRSKNTMARTPKTAENTEIEEVTEETVEETNEDGTRDYTVYADKPVTAAMADFHEWLNAEVGDLAEMDTERIVSLAGTLRMDFQRSEFNIERRAQRQAEREEARQAAADAKAAAKAEKEAAAAAEPVEEESEEGAPAKATAGRKAPATKGATGAPAGKPTAQRGRKPAAAATDAPY